MCQQNRKKTNLAQMRNLEEKIKEKPMRINEVILINDCMTNNEKSTKTNQKIQKRRQIEGEQNKIRLHETEDERSNLKII